MTIAGSRRSRAFAALLALVVVSGGCGRYARSGAAPETSPSKAPVKYGSGIKVEDPISSGGSKETTGRLEIQVVDENVGRPMEGVYVTYKGAQRGRMRTDDRGIARARLKPGRYVLAVATCGDTVIIDERVQGDAVIVAGRLRQGQLLVKYVAARFRPSNSVEATTEAPWARNDPIVLGVKIEDTCNYSTVATNAPIGNFAWRAAQGMKILQTPQRADARGYARVTVACTAAGNPDVFVSIPGSDPPIEVNVIEALSRPFNGEFCA